MGKILLSVAAFFYLFLSGCSLLMPGAGLEEFPLADIESISSHNVLQQKITLSFDDKQVVLIGVIEQRSGGIKIVGLTDFGKRILFVDYDGKSIKEELEPMLAEYFSGRDILLHYQMAFWSEEQLHKVISASDWDFVSNLTSVDFGDPNHQSDKKVIREFSYQGNIAYRVNLEMVKDEIIQAKVCNTELGYCLKFESL